MGWSEKDIERGFKNNQNNNKNFRRFLVAGIIVGLFFIVFLSISFYFDDEPEDRAVEDIEVAEEINDTEEGGGEELKEINLSDADSCQEGRFEVDFKVEDDDFDLQLFGKMNFHGLENGYCGISYSLDIPEENRNEIKEVLEVSSEDVDNSLEPHYIGEENFCFMSEENFSNFHQEIQEGLITGNHFLDCVNTSIQSEDQFLEFKEIIAEHKDENYFGKFEWDITTTLFMKSSFSQKIELMGSNDDGKCFFRLEIGEEELLEKDAPVPDEEGEELPPPPPNYCVVFCDNMIDQLLDSRTPEGLSVSTFQNPDELQHSEIIEREDGSSEMISYMAVMRNDIPCVQASKELIERDPEIDSEEEIFEALLNHEEVWDE